MILAIYLLELLEMDMGQDANNINEPLKVIFRCFENVENFISKTSYHLDILKCCLGIFLALFIHSQLGIFLSETWNSLYHKVAYFH